MIAMGLIYDYVRGVVIDEETGEIVEETIIAPGTGKRAYEPPQPIVDIAPPRVFGRVWRLFEILMSVSGALNIPKTVANECFDIAKKLVKGRALPRYRLEAIAGGIIYSVARTRNIDIDLEGVSKAAGVSKKEIRRAAKRIMLAGIIKKSKKDPGDAPLTLSEIPRLANTLGVSSDVEILAKRLVEMIAKTKPALIKSPRVTGAAMIYLSSILLNNRIPSRRISETVICSDIGLRNTARSVAEHMDIYVYV